MFGSRSRKVGGWKISGRVENWEDRKVLVFPYMCLVGRVEKWKGGKLFYLVREKSGRMENVVYMNWLLCEEIGMRRVGECNKCENIYVIYYPHHLFFLVFLLNWEEKIMWVRRDYFAHLFLSLLFSLLNQIRKNFIFHFIFLSFSILPVFNLTKQGLSSIILIVMREKIWILVPS